jgi:hypothetical protein
MKLANTLLIEDSDNDAAFFRGFYGSVPEC